jgi:hypothetical protein
VTTFREFTDEADVAAFVSLLREHGHVVWESRTGAMFWLRHRWWITLWETRRAASI